MKSKPTINYIVENNLCTGCGICQDACPKNAIKFKIQRGLNIPLIQTDICTHNKGCYHCFDVCPGKGFELNKLGNELFGGNEYSHDNYIGNYLSCYSGYSLDQFIRFHSASGGLLSQFLIYLLEKEIITGAVVTGFECKDLMKPLSYIATTRQEIQDAKSSKYCPVSLNGMASMLKEKDGKFIVVGLPCHIQGFRTLEMIDKKLKSKILGYFAIYCSSTRNFYAQKYITQKYNIERNQLKYFAYRDDGCLGYLKAEHVDGRTAKVDFEIYYHSLRSFFKPRRCLTCIDHYGFLADVSFGDIHIKPYSEDKVGINSLIVRNSYYNDLLKKANIEGAIALDELDVHIINESQKTMLYSKKRKVKALINLDKLVGKKTVKYDISIAEKPSLKDYISVFITQIQLSIGYRPWLWWLIDLSNIKRK